MNTHDNDDLYAFLQHAAGKAISAIEKDCIKMKHSNDDHSTLWLAEGDQKSRLAGIPIGLASFYSNYDGADIFSSAFKICSLTFPRGHMPDVPLTVTIDQMKLKCHELGVLFPAESIPFMTQSGIWYYGCQVNGSMIYEWDAEENCISGTYTSVVAVLREWIANVI